VTALAALDELDASLTERGVELWLCSLTPRPLEMLRRSDLADQFEDRLFTTLDAAWTAYPNLKP
jgi:MFS superfamily sulfate permease-like transporter